MKNVEKDVLHRREERRMGMRDRRGWWMWLRWQPRWRPAINQRIGDHPLPIYRKRLVEVTASLEASNQPEDRRPSFAELQKEVSRGDGLAGDQLSTRGLDRRPFFAELQKEVSIEVTVINQRIGGHPLQSYRKRLVKRWQRLTRGSATILCPATERG